VPFAHLPGKDLASDLKALQAVSPRVTGVRMICNFSAKDSALTYPHVERDWLARGGHSDFLSGLALLSRHGLSYDAQVIPEQLKDLAAAAKSCPETTIVLDHMGCPRLDRGPKSGWSSGNTAMWGLWREGMKALSALPNVFVKLSFPSHVSPRAFASDSTAMGSLVTECIDLFAANRCMVAGNWPVDEFMSGMTIHQLMDRFRTWVGSRSKEDRRRLFHDTAAAVYRIAGAEIEFPLA